MISACGIETFFSHLLPKRGLSFKLMISACGIETTPINYIMSAKLPIIKEPHPQPLPAGGEGRQSVALAGWGSWVLISNQADMILVPGDSWDAFKLMISACGIETFSYQTKLK